MKAEIALEGLTFYAYHGYYEEERRYGNRFSVDIKVRLTVAENQNLGKLENTVNYENLYSIVKSTMERPEELLENVCKQIMNRIFETWTIVESCDVSLSKFHPPVGGPCEKAKVTLTGTR